MNSQLNYKNCNNFNPTNNNNQLGGFNSYMQPTGSDSFFQMNNSNILPYNFKNNQIGMKYNQKIPNKKMQHAPVSSVL